MFLSLLVPNTCALLYLGLVHQRGPLDVMQVLGEEVKGHSHPDILFLMPCHSTPYYSHLHQNVTMRFLTCEPNLKGEEGYLDEADLFDNDPITWMQREYGSLPSRLADSTEREGRGISGDIEKGNGEVVERGSEEDRKEKSGYSEEGNRVTVESGNEGERKGTRENTDEQNGETIERRSKTGDRSNLMRSPPHSLPSHIVMFSVLSSKVKEFLSLHRYHLCHQLFHAHIEDGRRSKHIHIYCRA